MNSYDENLNRIYGNFKTFLKVIVKDEHKSNLDLIPDTVDEFLSYLIVLNYKCVSDLVDYFGQISGINSDDYDEKDFDKFKLYIEYFFEQLE